MSNDAPSCHHVITGESQGVTHCRKTLLRRSFSLSLSLSLSLTTRAPPFLDSLSDHPPSDHGPTRPHKVPATHAQPAQHHHHSSHPACLASDPNLERRSRAIDSCLLCRWFCLVHTFEDTYCPSSPPSPSLPSLLLALPPLSRARALSLRPSFSASPSKSVHVLSPKS